MPGIAKKRGYSKPKTGKTKRRQIDDQKANFTIMRSPAPKMFKTSMRYADTISLNPGVGGAVNVHTFRANSLYDPDVTGIGHQPRGFDQLIALYDHYVVTNAKITVQFGAPNNETINYIVGISLQDDGTTSTDIRDYLERGYTVNTMLGSGAGASPKKLVMYSDTAKFLGRSGVLQDSQLKGSDSGNPAETLVFHVFATSADLTDTGAIYIYVTIDFNAWFIEPKDVALS